MTKTIGLSGYAIASVLQLRYQEKDFSLLTPIVTTSGLGTETITVTAAAKGLTKSAKVGIGVGVPLVVLLCAVGIGVCIMLTKKRLKSTRVISTNAGSDGHYIGEAEIVGAVERHELDSKSRTFELQGSGSNHIS